MDPISMLGGFMSQGANVLGQGLGLALPFMSAAQNQYQADKNYRQSKRAFEYQTQLNLELMKREDNAVQRRAKDLEAAGISKTLAAGGSAGAGGSVHVGAAPQRDAQPFDKAMVAMSIKNAREQHQLVQKQQYTADLNNAHQQLVNDFTKWEFETMKKRGQTRHDSLIGKNLKDLGFSGLDFLEKLKPEIEKKLGKGYDEMTDDDWIKYVKGMFKK